jgi:glycosyltransferase involved in cell wall biosynthesis
MLAQVTGAIESWILRSADGVVAIHDRFESYIVHSLNVASRDVKVIRNWTHLPKSPAVGQQQTRRELGWSSEDVIVLHSGNMGKKQGLDNVIEAARVADERHSNVKFVLMGDGNQRETLEAKAAGLSSIRFVDPLPGEQFQRALAAADVLLVNELPGVKDMAVPSKLTSYFNAGLPVIAATDAGSVTASEIKVSGGGIRIDAADPARLVDAAESLAQDKELASRLGAQGLLFRYETLSEEAAVGNYNDFITSLASSHGR